MSKRTCSVTDCETPSRSLGMCDTHYRRYKKFGTTEDPKTRLRTFEKMCAICDDSFTAKSNSAKYCGSKCRTLARPGLPPLFCANCDKRIPNSNSSAPQGKARCKECINGGVGYYVDERGRRWSHGASAYRNGCRCAVCTEAVRVAALQYAAEYKRKHGITPSTAYRRAGKAGDPRSSSVIRKYVPCRVCGEYVHSGRPVGVAVHKACDDRNYFFVTREDRLAIYERDEWTCQICFVAVDQDAHYLSSWYPTLDHIVPQSYSLVPDHSPEALRTTHRFCNLSRGDRPIKDDWVVREKALEKRRLEVPNGREETVAPCQGGEAGRGSATAVLF